MLDGEVVDLALHATELGPFLDDERHLLFGFARLLVDELAVTEDADLDGGAASQSCDWSVIECVLSVVSGGTWLFDGDEAVVAVVAALHDAASPGGRLGKEHERFTLASRRAVASLTVAAAWGCSATVSAIAVGPGSTSTG